jgi:hypothetical protein
LEREGPIVQKSISSPSESLKAVSPRSVMGKRGHWIPVLMKRLGQKTGEPIVSSYPNKEDKLS